MSQTRLGSFTEAWGNILVGFTINYVANMYLIPVFVHDSTGHSVHINPIANFVMGLVYTVISLARSYALRRWFNGLKFGNHETKEIEIPHKVVKRACEGHSMLCTCDDCITGR